MATKILTLSLPGLFYQISAYVLFQLVSLFLRGWHISVK